MTNDQKLLRKKSATEGNIKWIKDNCLRTMEGDDDYVFISYKSDDFDIVLNDIVYKTCKKYGLRVYFDTAFDDNSDSWISQYYENMCDLKCKAFIAFLDNAYYSSYACLLEMMSRKTAAAGGDYKMDTLFFLPINLEKIIDKTTNENTGLGTRRFSNGKINHHAKEELTQFNLVFREIADGFMKKSVYKRASETEDGAEPVLYEEPTDDSPKNGEMYLNVTQCIRLMERVVPESNENDGSNKDFVEVIHDKLINAGISSVFADPKSDEKSNNAVAPISKTPAPSNPDPTQKKYGHTVSRNGTYDVYYSVDKDSKYTILKGSRINFFEKYVAKNLLNEVRTKLDGNILTGDIKDLARSTAGKIITGMSTDGKFLENNLQDHPFDIPVMTKNKQTSPDKNTDKAPAKAPDEAIAKSPDKAPDKETPPIIRPVPLTGKATTNQRNGSKTPVHKFDIMVYGTKYENQGTKEMLLTICPEIIRHHPDKLDMIVRDVYNIVYTENKNANNVVFSRGASFDINGRSVFIATHMSSSDALKRIEKLKNICGENDDNICITESHE